MSLESIFCKIFGFGLVFVFAYIDRVQAQNNIYNVVKFGAIPDGITDNSKAFLAAWEKACESSGQESVVLIPKGQFLVRFVEFNGPCKSLITFLNYGTIIASTDLSTIKEDTWLIFRRVENLIVTGGGTFNGQGGSAWPLCHDNAVCKFPVSIRFNSVTNASIYDIQSINSKNFHMSVYGSTKVTFTRLKITAPAESPNTDGIHISTSTDVKVTDSYIGTGDDCVSIGHGTKNIDITNVRCGPGHGISVGSLGKIAGEGDVSELRVINCTLTGTDNGVRIKTWATQYASAVYNLTFQDIKMVDVENPILIDQLYCPDGECTKKGSSRVQISDVKYYNILGTSKTKVAVELTCSESHPCNRIELRDIDLTYGGEKDTTTSSCVNVRGTANGKQRPPSCVTNSQ